MWYNTTYTIVTVYNVVSFNETCVQSGDDVGNPLVSSHPTATIEAKVVI